LIGGNALDKYDVIVVGAGPAGSTVAAAVAKSGFSTLVVERRRVVGLPVQCGELLPTPREMADLFPNSPRAQRLADVPSDVIVNRTRTMRLVSPKGRAYDFPLEASILDRTKFDQHLATRAQDYGAELLLATRATRRDPDNTVRLRGPAGMSEVRGTVVVGADGPLSLISRSIGNVYQRPDFQLSQAQSVTLTNIEIDSTIAEMYFGSSVAPGGYAWVIPRGPDEANIGMGFRPAFAEPSCGLRDHLRAFAYSHPLVAPRTRSGRPVRRVAATIPVSGPVRRTWADNVVLVGDAAGHVMASNGGGIPTAMVGGEIAAESIVAFLENGVPLSSYENGWRREMGRELESALAVLRVADEVMLSDTVTEICMRLAGSFFLEPLIRCRLPGPVSLAARTLVPVLQRLS